MIPLIQNDKYDISALEKSWEYVRINISSVETTYFSALAAKTYDLFSEYAAKDNIPMAFVDLLCILGQFKTVGEYERYSIPDIIKKVVASLILRLQHDYNYGEETSFVMMYYDECYMLDDKTFDITPIIKKQSCKK